MSVRTATDPTPSRAPLVFGAGLLVLCLVLLVGIALRVSLREDNDVVARAGISAVLTGGFSDFRDTTLLIVLAVGAYLSCLWALRKGFRHDFAAVIAGTFLAGMAMLPAMPLTSPDAVHLAADVRTFWIHHKWPAEFSGAPGKIDDPVANEVRTFRDSPSGYGPLAYAIGGAPIPFVGDGFKANLVGQKVMGLLFLTGTVALAGLLARRLGQNAAFVAGIIGLNPMMIWQYPGDGHNDVMMAFFGVLALWLVLEPDWNHRFAGVVAWTASTLCKFALVVASPVVACYWWPKWRTTLALLMVAGATTVLLAVILGFGPLQTGTLGPAGAIIETTPWHWLTNLFDTSGRGNDRLVVSAFVLYIFFLGLVMLYHPLETRTDLVAAVGLLMMFFLYTAPGYHPWYIIWYLPFVAMSGRRWLMVAGVVYSIGAFLPVLALNWRITLDEEVGIAHAVAWATAAMWFGTVAAAWIGWRGRRWANFGGMSTTKTAGPRFQARQRKRSRA